VYVWKVNGVAKQTDTHNGVTTATDTDTFDLSNPANGVKKGDKITVEVTPSDAGNSSANPAINPATGAVVTATATVVNSAPVVDSVAITPATPTVKSQLTATVTDHDDDGDPITLTYVWKDGNHVLRTVTKKGSSNTTDTLTLTKFPIVDLGDNITVTVTPFDGTAHGTPVTQSVQIVGPTASVQLSSTTPKPGDTLMANVITTDPNNKPVTLTYVWEVNGVVKQTDIHKAITAGTDSDTFDLSKPGHGKKGDKITLKVTPVDSDGITGAVQTATAIITA
jgi:hypothetical protein